MDDSLAVGDSVTITKSPAATGMQAEDENAAADGGGNGNGNGNGGEAVDWPEVTVSVPEGTSIVGCEATDECYIPSSVTVPAGATVTWSNDDTAAHTVTSTPESPMEFNSNLFMPGATFGVEFEDPGEYPYLCIVHPWMTGTVIVE